MVFSDITERWERERIERLFGAYLDPRIVERLIRDGDAAGRGTRQEMTILFCDLRGFTRISEMLSAEQLIDFANAFFSIMTEPVTRHRGVTDKFIGDSIMAFWNAPVDVVVHPQKALRAALGMRETLARLNAEDAFGFGAGHEVRIGIGIHTGLACVGNMGAETRFNYSAVGDTVNIAARIEAACKDVNFDVLVSEATAEALPDCALLDAGSLGLKGKTTRTRLFAVAGDENLAASPAFAELRRLHERLVTVLRTRATSSRSIINAAKLKSAALAPGLVGFYTRISRRSEHFAETPVEDAKRPAE